MERLTSIADLRARHRAGTGCLYNDFNPRGDAAMNVLHAASCGWMNPDRARQGANLSYDKYYFDTLPEAERWLKSMRGGEGIAWKRCGSGCLGRLSSGQVDAIADEPTPTSASALRGGRTWSVQAGAELVEAWSLRRLPFEPTGELMHLRSALKRALLSLEVPKGSLLRAVYCSTDRSLVDLENVLFYNVGVQAFNSVARSGVVFEREFELPPDTRDGQEHYWRYEAVEDVKFERVARSEPVALFEAALPEPPTESTKVAVVWQAIRAGSISVDKPLPADDAFGLDLTLSLPVAPRNVVSFVKPVIDGVLAGLQAYEGQELAEVSRRVGRQLHLPAEQVEALLQPLGQEAFAPGRTLWPRRDGVQWNPPDDRLIAAAIRLERGATCRISGDLFAAHPAR